MTRILCGVTVAAVAIGLVSLALAWGRPGWVPARARLAFDRLAGWTNLDTPGLASGGEDDDDRAPGPARTKGRRRDRGGRGDRLSRARGKASKGIVRLKLFLG